MERIELDGMVLDDLMFWRDGQCYLLSHAQSVLLGTLLKHPNRFYSARQLITLLNYDLSDGGMSALVRRLRRKIEDDPYHPKIVRSTRPQGYVLVTDPQIAEMLDRRKS